MICVMKLKFSDFINEKYEDWRRKQGEGEKRTVTRFAEWLGIPQSTVATWLSGGYPPSNEGTIRKLADKLGPDVYDILGIKDPFVIEIMNKLDKLTPENRAKAEALIKKLSDAETKRRNQLQ